MNSETVEKMKVFIKGQEELYFNEPSLGHEIYRGNQTDLPVKRRSPIHLYQEFQIKKAQEFDSKSGKKLKDELNNYKRFKVLEGEEWNQFNNRINSSFNSYQTISYNQINSSNSQQPIFVPDDSPPPPNPYELVYQNQLKNDEQFNNDEFQSSITLLNQNLILEEQIQWSKSIKLNHFTPIFTTNHHSNFNFNSKVSQNVNLKSKPLLKFMKKGFKDKLMESCKMKVIKQVNSSTLLKMTSQKDENLLERISKIPLPIILSKRPRPNYIKNCFDENEYDDSIQEEEEEDYYELEDKEEGLNKNGKPRAKRMKNSPNSPELNLFNENVKPFIAKLTYLLQNSKFYDSIIQWDSTGEFIIINFFHSKLISQILPMFFSHKSISAFQRQLGVYQFSRISNLKLSNLKFLSHQDIKFYSGFHHLSFFQFTPIKNLSLFLPIPSKARKLKKKI